MVGIPEAQMSEDVLIVSPIIGIGKRCTKCGKIKSINEFYASKKYGCRSDCNICAIKSSSVWKKANPEKVRKIQRGSGKRWQKANLKKCCKAALKWREKNPEKYLETARKAVAKIRGTLHGTLDNRMSGAIKLSLKCGKQGHRWESLVDYTVNDLKTHIENLFKEGMNWERFMKGEIHIDHIIPKSVFNFEKIEDDDFKKCWALENLQPLWAKDNLSKHNHLI